MFKIDSFLDQKLEKKELWKILTWLYPKWGIIHFVYKLFSKVKTKIDKVSKNPATLAQTTNFGTVAKWYFKNGLEHHLWAITARCIDRFILKTSVVCLAHSKLEKNWKIPNCQILNWSDFYKIDRLFIENLDSLQIYFLRPKSFCFLFHYFQSYRKMGM